MEIKKGDLVRVHGGTPKMYLSCHSGLYSAFAGVVIEIEGDNALIKSSIHIKPTAKLAIPTKYLTKINVEANANEELQEEYARFMSGRTSISFADRIAREHIQRRMRVLSQDDLLKDFDPWEHKITPERPTYEVAVDNVTINWQRYEADLAKEIAVKLSKPNENKPGYVADYAVSVAKAVVENLKKK